MEKYDVIIIGAGIAGITFGYLMKKANKSVLIVEKSNLESKDKLCGGLMTKKSYDLLCSIYNIDSEKLNVKNHNKCIINNDKNRIEIEAEIYTVHRKLLDNYILNEYINLGGEIISETRYECIDIENSVVKINNKDYQYDYLISADGVFSQVRKQISGKNQDVNFALETFDKQGNRDIEIYFLQGFKGYGWIIPNSNNSMIGIGEVSGKSKIETFFNSYLEKINTPRNNIRGAFLPSGKDIFLRYKNIFFIGDSAGLISPITGEGIYYALLSAKILSENLNKKYTIKMSKIKRKIRMELLYKKYVYNERLRNFIFSKYDNYIIRCIINKFANIIL